MKQSTIKRKEMYIRISDIPEALYKAIDANSKKSMRPHGKEILVFLMDKKYK
jgi:hypothetical protein